MASVPCSDSARKASARVGVGRPALLEARPRPGPTPRPGPGPRRSRGGHGEDARGPVRARRRPPAWTAPTAARSCSPAAASGITAARASPSASSSQGPGTVPDPRPGQAELAHPSSLARPDRATRERSLTTETALGGKH